MYTQYQLKKSRTYFKSTRVLVQVFMKPLKRLLGLMVKFYTVLPLVTNTPCFCFRWRISSFVSGAPDSGIQVDPQWSESKTEGQKAPTLSSPRNGNTCLIIYTYILLDRSTMSSRPVSSQESMRLSEDMTFGQALSAGKRSCLFQILYWQDGCTSFRLLRKCLGCTSFFLCHLHSTF